MTKGTRTRARLPKHQRRLEQTSVRYIKNGRGGRWWKAAKQNSQIHAGWSTIPHELLLHPNYRTIEKMLVRQFKKGGSDRGAAKRDFNALHALLDHPEQHVWITFEDSCMWWCTVKPGAVTNPDDANKELGNFWLECDLPWSNRSLVKGQLLATIDLPGAVTSTAGFRGTVCKPEAEEQILRIIHDERDPDVMASERARVKYEKAIGRVIQRLTPKDFEQLIDLMLARTGWARVSQRGKATPDIDIAAMNIAADEIAFVQVKSTADQSVLDTYVEKFQEQPGVYNRMIFAVHTPRGTLTPPLDLPVQVWAGERLNIMVVQLGLGDFVENKVA